MERLTDCAQGYCEMYCKKYERCFGYPDDCIFKDEIKLYEAVKSIEGIVPFDRLLELACADKAGRLVELGQQVGVPTPIAQMFLWCIHILEEKNEGVFEL